MKPFYSLVTAPTFSSCNFSFSKRGFLLSVLVFILLPFLPAQQLIINPGSNLILNGNVSLVINNVALLNNGSFNAGAGTVNFTGHSDTMLSYISGTNTTTFNNLTVTKTAFGIALKSPVNIKNVLTISSGNLYTDSNLTLKSDQNLTARVAPIVSGSGVIGKANVERYIPARRSWRLITAPVTNSSSIFKSWQNNGNYAAGLGLFITGPNPTGYLGNGLDVSLQNNVSMKTFNYATQSFSNIVNTKVAISPGISGSADNMGYFIFVRGDRNPVNISAAIVNTTTITSIGTLQTGTQTFTASADTNKRYTLIGNPYASPVDFDLIIKNNLKKRFYVWDPTINSLGGYVMLDDLNNDGIYVKSVAGSAQTKDIQSSQAFFVQTINNAPASLTFNESCKSGGDNNLVFRPVTPNKPSGLGTGQIVTTLNLVEADSSTILADGAIAEFDNNYSAEIDLDDAVKFSNSNENISIVRNNVLLTAERRPALTFMDTVYLRLTNTTKRNYQFVFEVSNLEEPGMAGFLEDSYLGTSTVISLSGNTIINFTINKDVASSSVNRFKIVFKPTVIILPVTISSVNASKKEKAIAVEWKVENEINMLQYDVEKSTDGKTFYPVHTTKVPGTNNSYNSYNWLDVNPANGNNFYRVKSVDQSGAIKYSSVVKVSAGNNSGSFTIYPNPVTGNMIRLVMNNQPADVLQLQLTNTGGQVIIEKVIKSVGGDSIEMISTGTKLPAGIYHLSIMNSNKKLSTQKVIIE